MASLAASAQAPSGNAPVAFDIPAQALGTALSSYGDQAGHEVLYDTGLAIDRRSAEVRGDFTPAEALDRLLAGTNLSARFLSGNAFVLLPTPSPATADKRARAVVAHQHYYALIQHTLLDALCGSQHARPGQYRLVMLLWLRSDGQIDRFQRLGSVGRADADRQVDAAVGTVRLRDPLPADFEQPVLIVLLPQAPGVTPGCTGADTRTGGRVP